MPDHYGIGDYSSPTYDGDLNYDRYDDFLPKGRIGGNRSLIFFGGPNGLSESIDWWAGTNAGSRMTTGDFNGDLLLDIAYGSSGANSAYVHYNNADDPITGLEIQLPDPIELNTQLTFTSTIDTGSNISYAWILEKWPMENATNITDTLSVTVHKRLSNPQMLPTC